ncbi:MAG: hypothetical protein AB7E48_05170 [Deferribacterales bacterium]
MFGYWLIWKTACQLTSNISPGFGLAMSVLIPEKSYSRRVQGLYYDSALKTAKLWLVFSTVIASSVMIFYYKFSGMTALGLILFWSGLYFSGFTGAVARGNKNGQMLLLGGLCEAVGAVLSIAAAFMHNFELFILSQGIKSWLKTFVQYVPSSINRKIGYKTRLTVLKQITKVGIPLCLKGWVQTAYQYGDKMILGIFFGASVAGVIGLGGLYAMPIIILSSSASAWLLPLLLSGKEKKENMVYKQMFLSLLLSSFLSVFIVFMPLAIPDSAEHIDVILLAYTQVSLLSAMTIHSTYIISLGRKWLAVLIDLSVVGIVFLIMFIGKNYSAEISSVLISVIVLVALLFLCVSYILKTFNTLYPRAALMVAGFLSFNLLYFAVLKENILGDTGRYMFAVLFLSASLVLITAYYIKKKYHSKRCL